MGEPLSSCRGLDSGSLLWNLFENIEKALGRRPVKIGAAGEVVFTAVM
jgi:hypothetical protein